MDELSPLFHDIEFNERFRGYDVEEVDAYVDRVAKAAALVQGRIAELQERVASAEGNPRRPVAAAPAEGDVDDARLSRVLILAQRTADAAIEEAKAEAEALRIDAAADAEQIRRDADDHASLVLAETETDRRKMIADAEQAAAAAVEVERERVAAEVAALEARRAHLGDEITMLELHMAETRLAVAASVAALTDVLDSPAGFRAPGGSDDIVDQEPAELEAHVAVPAAAEATEVEATETVEPEIVESEIVELEAVEPEAVESEIVEPEAVEPETVEPVLDITDHADQVDEPEIQGVDGEAASFDAWAQSPDQDEAIDLEIDVSSAVEPTVFDVDLVDTIDTDDESSVLDLTTDVDASPVALDDRGPADTSALAPQVVAPSVILDDPEPSPAPPLLVTAADMAAEPAGDFTVAASAADLVQPEMIEQAQPKTEEFLFVPDDAPQADDFLDQLRGAVTANDGEDFGEDALAAFFDAGDEPADKSWFNRRR